MKHDDLYKAAGVDTAKGDALVDWLVKTPCSGNTRNGAIVSGIGGFAGLFRPEFSSYKKPLLVASTDGVGTKLLLAIENNKLSGLGQDLVAMCVNDLYCVGATPLFFIDYYATGKLADAQFKQILASIKSALNMCATALLGGETAELPGLYHTGHFDLAGFVVGVVDEEQMLGAQNVKAGDKLYALPSSGFHSNGYSLLRKWLADNKKLQQASIVENLLTPTEIYHAIPAILRTVGKNVFHAVAHITGGGISGNLPRVIPQGLNAHIEKSKVPTPTWMREFISANGATLESVEEVFNLGCGMIAAVAAGNEDSFVEACNKHSYKPVLFGEVRPGSAGQEAKVIYQ